MSHRVPVDGKAFSAGRKARGLTVEQAAAYLGLEPHVLSGIEKGHRTLSAAQAVEVFDRLSKMRAMSTPGAARPPLPVGVISSDVVAVGEA